MSVISVAGGIGVGTGVGGDVGVGAGEGVGIGFGVDGGAGVGSGAGTGTGAVVGACTERLSVVYEDLISTDNPVTIVRIISTITLLRIGGFIFRLI